MSGGGCGGDRYGGGVAAYRVGVDGVDEVVVRHRNAGARGQPGDREH
ncbi:hypothetical protein [Streptomyces sp. ISL-100]|nr:hypothetical protein [Streptomyces sp. ISL-100]MBT2400851.1 hypothetical protein [Streptomyces sp. ISL-100]